MNNSPKITIITPVFNGEAYISETIESVLKASISVQYEYLVIDDGSTDSSKAIADSYKNYITILSHKNSGESATVNRGIENAKGEFILVLNADDPLLNGELINKSCKIMSENPSIVAVYPDWKIIDQHSRTIKIRKLPDFTDEVFIGNCKCLPGPGTIFRRDKAQSIGGRDSKWKFVGDYDFWLRLSRLGMVVHLPEVLAQWRQNNNSTSISQRNEKMANERIHVIQNFLENNPVPTRISKMALGNAHYLAARLAFFDPNIKGRSLLFKAIRFRRGWPEVARPYVVFYLMLMPVSSKMLTPFKKIITRFISYK